jgi:DNA recombination protein RmuC
LDTVKNSIYDAGIRTRAIERQLRGVEALPQAQATALLGEANEETTLP